MCLCHANTYNLARCQKNAMYGLGNKWPVLNKDEATRLCKLWLVEGLSIDASLHTAQHVHVNETEPRYLDPLSDEELERRAWL